MITVGGFKKMFDSPEALANIGVNIREIITLLKARGSSIDISTRFFANTTSRLLGFVLKSIVFKEENLINKMLRLLFQPTNLWRIALT
jgi:2-dehydropantoate 2-reductase